MTLFFIMILSLGKGAVEAGGIPMWHVPGAAAGHKFFKGIKGLLICFYLYIIGGN